MLSLSGHSNPEQECLHERGDSVLTSLKHYDSDRNATMQHILQYSPDNELWFVHLEGYNVALLRLDL